MGKHDFIRRDVDPRERMRIKALCDCTNLMRATRAFMDTFALPGERPDYEGAEYRAVLNAMYDVSEIDAIYEQSAEIAPVTADDTDFFGFPLGSPESQAADAQFTDCRPDPLGLAVRS